MNELRQLPSVDQILQSPRAAAWYSSFGRPLTLEAIRRVMDEARTEFSETKTIPTQDVLFGKVDIYLSDWTASDLGEVINATGVVLHTNLGRAPLSTSAIAAIRSVSAGYSTLEFELSTGRRGSRTVHAEAMLTRLTGAEAALVVNNNASALLLCLSALASRRRVVIARSQLVEIGGGFRIPDVMKQSGAKLVEIGATNRVHLEDYQRAMQEGPIRLVLHAHRSNFQILGFTSEPSLAEIVEAAHQNGISVLDDLGSGALLDTATFGLAHEPTVQESLAAEVDLVCFSGDKLLGGPQAGIILGRADLLAKLKKHPLARAIRADKLCLAALSATLLHYIKDEAVTHIPVWTMIAEPLDVIETRTHEWAAYLGCGEIIPGHSTVGGGSLPGEELPTWLLSITVKHPDRLLAQLRQLQPPVIARVEKDQVLLDPRTVLREQEHTLLANLRVTLATSNYPREKLRK
jgi:L-seryl-tRNA(Ser) seleniumtransferase